LIWSTASFTPFLLTRTNLLRWALSIGFLFATARAYIDSDKVNPAISVAIAITVPDKMTP
jgi:hypothetical protein